MRSTNYHETQLMRLHAYFTYVCAPGAIMTREVMLEYLSGILEGDPPALALLDEFLDPTSEDNRPVANFRTRERAIDRYAKGCRAANLEQNLKAVDNKI